MAFQGESLVQRRRASLHKLKMPNMFDDFCRAPLDREEVVEEGKELFAHFVSEEIEKEGISTPNVRQDCLTYCNSVSVTPGTGSLDGYKNPIWASAGRELRMMADEFAKTKEREKVKRRAEKVGIREVTYEQFRDLLKELFTQGGVTKERIMVLFFFCSDVAIRTLNSHLGASGQFFRQFLSWSFSFISEYVCSWVQEHGGWGAVLNSSVQYIQRAVLLCGIGLLVAFGIKKLYLQLK